MVSTYSSARTQTAHVTQKPMASRIIKNLLALSWISVVVYAYFRNHTYLGSGWESIATFLPYILFIPVVYGCYALYQWFEKGEKNLKIKITFARVLAAAILLIFVAGNAAFLIKSPSYYHGNDIFYVEDESGGRLEIISDLSTLTGNEVLVLGHESALEETNAALTNWIPVEIVSYFERPTFLRIEFGIITKSLGLLGIFGLLTVTAMSLGLTIFRKITRSNKTDSESILISFGLGLFGISTFLFLLGAAHILTYLSAWILFALILAASYKSLAEILQKLMKWEHTIETPIANFDIVIVMTLLLFAASNFIDNISPMPRGWDGMNQYVNTAKSLYLEHGLISNGLTYGWELITSLGFIMFNWTTATLNLHSFFPGLIAMIALYIVARKFMSTRASLIVVASLYLTPLYQFHGVEDNKVDLAHLFTGIVAILSVYKSFTADTKREKYGLMAIGGILAGFALGIKLTAIILIFGLAIATLYYELGISVAIGAIVGAVGLFAITQAISTGSELEIQPSTYNVVGTVLVLISIGVIGLKLIQKKSAKPLIAMGIFLVFAGISFSPWLIKNFIETDSLNPGSLLSGQSAMPQIDHDLLENDYGLDYGLCESTGTREELQRYMGYDDIITRYLTMPWHLTMNDQGTSGIYIDFGWIPLAFIPGLLLFIPFKKPSRKIAAILVFTIAYWTIWLITSYGIIWYGLPGFVGLSIIIGLLIDNYEEQSGYHRQIINIAIALFLISTLIFRLSMFGKGTLLMYTAGNMTEEEAIKSIFPYAPTVGEMLNADQDGEYDLIWKVGTNLSYFIDDNFARVRNDQYLDDLNCLYIERDADLLTERLKALGYGYILFDYYTYSLSPDPEGSLYQKYTAALQYILNETDIVVSDYYRGHMVIKLPGT